jgi:hypothetical protein
VTAALVFGNVVLPYAFNSGITVIEELSRRLFVWLTFVGAVAAMRDRVDDLADLRPVVYSIELPNLERVKELGYTEHAFRCVKSAKRHFAAHPRVVAMRSSRTSAAQSGAGGLDLVGAAG